MTTSERRRRTGHERRSELVEAALAEFAEHGLHMTTAAAARRAGVSQPYVFHYFPDKNALIAAALDLGYNRIREAFIRAAHGAPEGLEPRLTAMSAEFGELLRERAPLLALLQSFAACREPDLRGLVRGHLDGLLLLVEELSGASRAVASMFFSQGLLLTVAAATGLEDVPMTPPWAEHLNLFTE